MLHVLKLCIHSFEELTAGLEKISYFSVQNPENFLKEVNEDSEHN